MNKMNVSRFTNLLMIGLIVSFAATGCRKRPTPLTNIPNPPRAGEPGDAGTAGPLNPDIPPITMDTNFVGSPLGPGHPGFTRNAEAFKAYTVHFDYDSAAIKGAEKAKVV